ncbi:peptide deformylase [Mageeibacillus indolicus]|jgi:hypothetical protein|uniref:Peptide deformylase n=2 Tax=Mageeibacillus indolicus TaxID=884684 RepID=D3R234_MAGIU|nr:peptide deformylase [Mageeibacillus indolicus]ADC90921.1 peptide deformylase [Mageeibacillus indolicus UPII9-5]KFA57396.1 peptide deformylase [Mageeibacillus indolicus 0009-5]PNH19725.1 peptide deformylase [Mageeibacillus indolicus]
MAVREIIVDGDDRLRKKARPVDNIADPKIQQIVDDMIDTLYATGNGVGLAAVQVGILKRIFVIDLQDGKGLKVYINPEIIDRQGSQCNQEGCLSLPGFWGEVIRPAKVTVRAFDRNGKQFEQTATGLGAICISHETDHLNGILFKDLVISEEEAARFKQK